jgi:hypothetical protein
MSAGPPWRILSPERPPTSPGPPRNLCVRLDAALDPGGGPLHSLITHKNLLPTGAKRHGPFQPGLFGTPNLHRRLYPLPLHLASFPAYASITLLPD